MTPQEKARFTKLEKNVDRILAILESDEKTGREGHGERIKNVEDQVGSLVTDNKVRKGKKAVYFFLGSIIYVALTEGLPKFVKFLKAMLAN